MYEVVGYPKEYADIVSIPRALVERWAGREGRRKDKYTRIAANKR